MKRYQLFINGKFSNASSGETFKVINPSTEEAVSEVPQGTVEDTRKAIDAAYEAQKGWAKLPAVERAKYLRKIADGIRKNSDMLVTTLVEEQGKTKSLARIEVDFTADYMDYMAEWARRIEGEVIQSDRPNENILLYKMPIGVVAGILPWNFPFFLIARKMAPALVTGNTIVIKPSSDTPNNAFEFAKIVAESELPKGVFNLVTGKGSVVGNELSSNPKVDMVSFTGSVEAGMKIMEAAAKTVKKVSLELGGKAPAIVMDDADIDLAVKSIRDSRIPNTGQICNCAERVYVHEKIADEFISKMTEAMKNSTYGDPMKEDVDMGPLINAQARERVDGMVKHAVEEGAELVIGGRDDKYEKGFFYKPTVLINCKQEMEIMHKEIFGPVLPIMKFKNLDEAIELANDCDYGLTSSIYTQNLDVAMRAANEIKFGETYVNRENFEAMQGFHAGWRKSGIGGDDGKHGVEEFLNTHVIYIQYDQEKK
ncbi:aldehyde dehydrogenase [Mesoaciditoga lauensis]|uniref:aldehyde dehydrogenase n=1 Tax=Mesoaciditoga lauensis TaxID=1495039 RepID=UPI0005663F67|nr:aldehyde dehydrogenase [Mesoaciditoga lauensis]